MVLIAVTLIPLLAALVAVIFRHSSAVRLIAVGVILVSALMTFGGLTAPHRVAEDLVHQSPQGPEWGRGAVDTRDVVHGILPMLASTFVALALVALVPARKNSTYRN